ncbi:hypothetical protein HK100_008404, partial [Physocladia obscura]
MGTHQSSMIKKELSDNSPSETSPDFAVKLKKSNLNSPQSEAAVKRSISISQTGTSTKYELRAAHVNTFVAKTWNPNDPQSWEPEMGEYHALPNSDYMLPNDA